MLNPSFDIAVTLDGLVFGNHAYKSSLIISSFCALVVACYPEMLISNGSGCLDMIRFAVLLLHLDIILETINRNIYSKPSR